MSSIVSHECRAMLCQLLAYEKEDTRVWLRAEMDDLVDSMFNRLANKLMMNSDLGRYESSDGDGAPVGNHDPQLEPSYSQVDQAAFVIAQPSTSCHLIAQHQNVHHSYQQQPNDPIHYNENFNQLSDLSTLVQPTMSPNAQVNSEALSTEHSKIQNFDDDYDEGECYCDECLGVIEIDDVVEDDDDDDDDDDSDSVQLIKDEQEAEESSVKRPRMESTQPSNETQPEVNSQSPRQPIKEAQPNQVNIKSFITVLLQCPLSECPDTFPEDQLTQHLFNVHSIGPSRCLLKDCAQAFDNSYLLRCHIAQSHPCTTQWNCAKCHRHFAKYQYLSDHNHHYHQLGLFQCSFPSCTFTGEYKQKVYSHYTQQHKSEFVCSQSACNYRTYKEAALKAHERAHLGIKPYLCKWPDCGFSSSYQQGAMNHIRIIHLASSNQNPNHYVAHSVDPKDYLEVENELLGNHV